MSTIILEGDPISKQRPRFNRATGSCYTEASHLKEMNLTKFLMHKHIEWNGLPMLDSESIISVKLWFYLPFPKSLTVAQKNRLSFDSRANTKPDIDNMIKYYLDCANGIFWEDDAIVQYIESSKFYSDTPYTRMDYMKREPLSTNKVTEVVTGVFGNERLKELARDIRSLAEVDIEDVEAMAKSEVTSHKTSTLDRVSQVIAKFSLQHGNELHDVQKNILKKNVVSLVV